MRCIVCDRHADNTINCTRHSIKISLCEKHISECDVCSNCKINFVKVAQ